jgi:energy-converting hydrogenase A subunit M
MVELSKSDRLIRSFAWKVFRRMSSGKVRVMEFEDIYQELLTVWCVARDKWNPDLGVPFNAYLMRGMKQHINRWVEKEFDFKQLAPYDMDDAGDEAGYGAHHFVADPVIRADEALEAQHVLERLHSELSMESNQFLDIMENPSDEVLQIVEAMRKRADYAKARGLNSLATDDLTPSLVMDLLGHNRSERKRIYDEIREVAAEVRKC